MNPGLDLRSEVRKGGLTMVFVGIGGFVVGVILAVIGAVTGFMLCIAIPLLLASPFAALWGIVQLVYPDIRLGHLGAGNQRTAAIQHVEAEARDPHTQYQATKNGKLWITPTWIVLLAGDEVMVSQRRDVLLVYTHVSRGRRSSSVSLKVRTRGKDFSCPMDEIETEWFMRTFQTAAPWAFYGYDPRLVALASGQLAYEVDRRMQPQSLPPQTGPGWG